MRAAATGSLLIAEVLVALSMFDSAFCTRMAKETCKIDEAIEDGPKLRSESFKVNHDEADKLSSRSSSDSLKVMNDAAANVSMKGFSYSYCYHCMDGYKVWVEREQTAFQDVRESFSFIDNVIGAAETLVNLKSLGLSWLIKKGARKLFKDTLWRLAEYLGGEDHNNDAWDISFYVSKPPYSVKKNLTQTRFTQSGDKENHIKTNFARAFTLPAIVDRLKRSYDPEDEEALDPDNLYLFRKHYQTIWMAENNCTTWALCYGTGASGYNLPDMMQALIAVTDHPAFCGQRGGLSESPQWRVTKSDWSHSRKTIVDCFESWDPPLYEKHEDDD